MEEVEDNPWSEICWYMPESREQYRLNGKLYIIKSDEKDEELKKVRRAGLEQHCNNMTQLGVLSCCRPSMH